VVLATAPKTGDISGILALISLTSLGGMILVNRKKDEE
jgi:LPXTG-motif cell wall-anchored protein